MDVGCALADQFPHRRSCGVGGLLLAGIQQSVGEAVLARCRSCGDRQPAQHVARDDAVLVVAEHRLNPLVVLDRLLRALVHGHAQFGGVSGALGGLAGTVQQRAVTRLDGLGEPPIGLARGAAGPLVRRFEGRRLDQRRLGAPPLQRRKQAEVSLRVHGLPHDLARSQLY